MEVIYDGNTVILEEYVEGHSLSDMAAKGISQAFLLHVLTDLLNIMKQIHSHNICHRDIKEENLLVRPNQSLVLIDFAIASLSSASTEATPTSDTLGTVNYAAPEQFGLTSCDCRSDIYSFGKVCQNLINKCKNLSDSFRYMLEEIIQRCTEFHPHKRYQSVDEILNILKQPSLFHGSPDEHIIKFAHADYPLCVQIYNNEEKILKDFPPYDRFLFSGNIFKDVESDNAKYDTLTEFYLLENSIVAVRITFTYNTFLSNKSAIANIYHARLLTFPAIMKFSFQIFMKVYRGLLYWGNTKVY